MFELKIYSFPTTFISGVIDSLCTAHIRKWLECPVSSCVTEWMSSPTKYCGLGIPTFAHRAERTLLAKRNALRNSKNVAIRELWSASRSSQANNKVDQLITNMDYKNAANQLREGQNKESLSHFLGLASQGRQAKMVSEVIPANRINSWKGAIEQLPGFAFNFVRKAIMNQLPTLSNLKLWGCSPTDCCPLCGLNQTNKHVVSNCSAPEVLARYLDRHNKILRLLANWIKPKLRGETLFCDLTIAGARHVSDLFVGVRPDLAVVNPSRIVVCEVTVCHETNLESSRLYTLNKYANKAAKKSFLVKNHLVKVYSLEVSTLGFISYDPNFLKEVSLPNFDRSFLTDITKTAVMATHDIYANR